MVIVFDGLVADGARIGMEPGIGVGPVARRVCRGVVGITTGTSSVVSLRGVDARAMGGVTALAAPRVDLLGCDGEGILGVIHRAKADASCGRG